MTNLSRNYPQDTLCDTYRSVRQHSVALCAPLETEDFVVQPTPEVSPPKWHLAHTTWFFEELLLVQYLPGYERVNAQYPHLFNSYYKSAGDHWLQSQRGQLSRPTVAQIMDYRTAVDRAMDRLLREVQLPQEALALLEVGLHHEQQHQELLLMDIKYILGCNPEPPVYRHGAPRSSNAVPRSWHRIKADNYTVGHIGDTFSFDNETPPHVVFIHDCQVREQLVSNAEFSQFIEAGGYQNPAYWLSLGWDWVQNQNIEHPLYWHRVNDQWHEFTLAGTLPLTPDAPVSHISYFEASAYASWAGARLPTEFELETYLGASASPDSEQVTIDDDLGGFHPTQLAVNAQQLWCWTSSSYAAYPGYRPYEGMLGEYNGKFMCNQYVLRGGCIATPPGHYRHSYRNFYLPDQRWMFSGIALAKETA